MTSWPITKKEVTEKEGFPISRQHFTHPISVVGSKPQAHPCSLLQPLGSFVPRSCLLCASFVPPFPPFPPDVHSLPAQHICPPPGFARTPPAVFLPCTPTRMSTPPARPPSRSPDPQVRTRRDSERITHSCLCSHTSTSAIVAPTSLSPAHRRARNSRRRDDRAGSIVRPVAPSVNRTPQCRNFYPMIPTLHTRCSDGTNWNSLI